jgi:hypothetical protein
MAVEKSAVRDALNSVTEWLLCASSQVGKEYFQLPIAGAEEHEYRERVYCYELYHRWRCQWTDGFRFSLCGEVDKSGHPVIKGNWKPDFLVHVPGQMVNLLVVEVKPSNADIGRMADDLSKLATFRGYPAKYFAAYFLVYGLSLGEWPSLRDQLVKATAGSVPFDPSLVSCFIHEKPGARAQVVDW